MFSTGLTSITFRQLDPTKIIQLTAQAGLDGIEWGSDIHVPPGEEKNAREIAAATHDAGLRTLSYGSYFRCSSRESDAVRPLLATAEILGAPVVRVWAGRKASADASTDDRQEVVVSLHNLLASAADLGITIALEYHGGTLTDTMQSAHQLLDEVADDRLRIYWQPRTGGNFDDDLIELRAALPHLAHIHAFHWSINDQGGIVRHPLESGISQWQQFLDIARIADGDHSIILEFVADNQPDQFLKDATTLKRLVATANNAPTN